MAKKKKLRLSDVEEPPPPEELVVVPRPPEPEPEIPDGPGREGEQVCESPRCPHCRDFRDNRNGTTRPLARPHGRAVIQLRQLELSMLAPSARELQPISTVAGLWLQVTTACIALRGTQQVANSRTSTPVALDCQAR
jgi:hypothetical protein